MRIPLQVLSLSSASQHYETALPTVTKTPGIGGWGGHHCACWACSDTLLAAGLPCLAPGAEQHGAAPAVEKTSGRGRGVGNSGPLS